MVIKYLRISAVNRIEDKLTWLVKGFNKPHPGFKSGPKRLFVVIFSLVVLFNFIITIFLIMEVTSLRIKTIEALKNADGVMEALALKQIFSEPGWIDPTSVDVQYIGFGFFVVNMRTEVSDAEVVVSGEIVNATSIDHYDARFTLFLEKGKDADFRIASIKSGLSAPFTVTIKTGRDPGTLETPNRARLIYRSSDVAYD